MTDVTEVAVPPAQPKAERTDEPRRSHRVHGDAIRRLLWVGPSFAMVILVFVWFATHGSWRLFDAENFGQYYDALAASILDGRLDVPDPVIGPEAFIHGGKFYGYFGPAPSLPRIPLNKLWPQMTGRWSRSFMLAGCLVTVIAAYAILLMLRRRPVEEGTDARRFTWVDGVLEAAFVLCVGLGSTNIFLASRSYVYHEANMWGSALALVTALCILRYLARPRPTWLLLAGLAAALSFHSRPTIGAGALLCCLLLCAGLAARAISNRTTVPRLPAVAGALAHVLTIPRVARPALHALLIAAVGASAVVAFLAMNWIKFRTLDGVPVKYYAQYIDHPERMERTRGRQMHLSNLRTGLAYNFSPTFITYGRSFPWAYFGKATAPYPEARFDYFGESSGLPATMPALFLLSAVGIAYMFLPGARQPVRRLRLPTVGLLGGGASVLLTVSVQERYLHDFVPCMALGAAASLAPALSWRSRRARMAAVAVVVPLTLYSVWVNTAHAYVHEADVVWGVDEDRRADLLRLRDRVDHLFLDDRLTVAKTDTDQTPPAPRRGQLWDVRATDARYWFDGRRWRTLHPGRTIGPIKLRITFGPLPAAGTEEVLVTAGTAGAGDFAYVRYEGGDQVTFGYDHWSTGGPTSRHFRVEPGKRYDLLVHFDAINRQTRFVFEGERALLHRGAVYPATPEQLRIGENHIGGHRTAGFSGKIERAE